MANKHGAVLEDVKSRSPLLLKGEGSFPILLPRGGVLLWQWRGLAVLFLSLIEGCRSGGSVGFFFAAYGEPENEISRGWGGISLLIC